MKQALDQQTIPLAEPFAENVYEKALPGHYRLIELVGRGGMAEVFRAEDMRLNRFVAIKFLNSEFRKDPERMRRFHQEARAASALNHPNIITIHDIGENEGIQYLVSEFVQGETLNSMLSRGSIPVAQAVDIAIQVASALAASHNAGIVHRDIKPDNVMLRRDGSVKVLDFGLAKETGISVPNTVDFDANTITTAATSPGLVLGTPRYMSPEQARGQHLDGRTDIFSLGIMLFEMVTGRPPFAGDTMVDVIAAIISKEPRTLEEYLDAPPLTLIHIVKKALRKDKDERYGSMEHLLSDLRDLKQELGGETYVRVDTAPEQTRITDHHTLRHFITDTFVHRPPVGAFLIFIFAILAAGVWWNFGGLSQATPSPPGSMRTVQIDSWSSDVGELMSSGEFSRDAKWAAFASTRSGQSEIWVKPILGGDAVQVSKNGYYNQYPIWSENGQELAFLSIRKESYGIWRAVFTGGQEVQIVGNLDPTARPVYWTPGGKIYFQERGELCVVDVASGQREQTTNFASRGIKARMIEISRDERSIVYSAKEDDDWKLRVMRLDAGTSEVIATSKDQIDYFAWRPGGDAIIFSGFADGTYQLFEAVPGRADPLQLSNGNEDFFALDISTDGKILYGSATESSDLWSVEVRGGKRSLVANDIAAEYWADISPDGSSIAFQSVPRAGTPFGGSIIVSSAGNPPIKVSSMASLPKWSPDGQWIAFLRKQETGTRELWKVRPSGDDATKLADGNVMATGATYMPYLKINTNTVTWSPDGTVVAYSTRPDGDKSNIWIVNADGSQKTQLTKNEEPTEIYYCPTWSPDGGLLVFMSERRAGTPPYRLWLYQSGNEEQRVIFESKEPFRLLGFVDGGSDVLISQNSPTAGQSNGPVSTDISTVSLQTGLRTKVNDLSNAYPYNLHLSPDGTSIAFVSRRDGQSVLLTVPIRGGVERELLVEDDPKILFSSLAWSPDGHRIVFGGQTRTSLISMLTK